MTQEVFLQQCSKTVSSTWWRTRPAAPASWAWRERSQFLRSLKAAGVGRWLPVCRRSTSSPWASATSSWDRRANPRSQQSAWRDRRGNAGAHAMTQHGRPHFHSLTNSNGCSVLHSGFSLKRDPLSTEAQKDQQNAEQQKSSTEVHYKDGFGIKFVVFLA